MRSLRMESSACPRTRSLSRRTRSTSSIKSRMRSDQAGSRALISLQEKLQFTCPLPRQQSSIEEDRRPATVFHLQPINDIDEPADRIWNFRLKRRVLGPDQLLEHVGI